MMGVPAFGLPKMRSFVGSIWIPALAAIATMVDHGKDRDSLGFNDCFQPCKCLQNGVRATPS